MTTTEPGNTPKPTPRPGPPRPGPKPSASPSHPPAPAAAAPPTCDPHRFGRVDDDGTVWLITAAGERNIGSWQAGDAESAYAHFGRRYDDLSTEVALLEHRLGSGSGDARKIKSAAATLLESVPTAAVLGDVDALTARLTAVVEAVAGVENSDVVLQVPTRDGQPRLSRDAGGAIVAAIPTPRQCIHLSASAPAVSVAADDYFL